MGTFDAILVGVPAIGALVLLIGAVMRWSQTHSGAYAVAAVLALLTGALTAYSIAAYPAGVALCVGRNFLLIAGVIAFLMASRRTGTSMAGG